jgi:putative transposase
MTKSKTAYPTDLNDTEWMQIAPYLPERKSKTGAPRRIPWRDILNGIFYVVKTGCNWRCLPHDFPKWKTVYHYFRQFRMTGLWEKLNAKLREILREKSGKKAQASIMIVDCQSAKSAEGGEKRGFDGGKKVNGRKRILVVDTNGLLILVKVTAANVQDVYAGKQIFEALIDRPHLIEQLKKIFADGGFRGNLVDWTEENLHASLEIVLKNQNQTGFQVLPMRWVIERTNAWITRSRRLARDYERLVATSEAFIYAAMIRIYLRRLANV